MDYNTQREKLILPEYGRCIQDMVNHALTIKDKRQRQNCAFTIIGLMANMQSYTGNEDDFYQKLWNHLAYISGYKLDINYPVKIERIEDQVKLRSKVPYPQQKIRRKHYGALVEELIARLCDMQPGKERDELTLAVANQMKRDLASWNSNALSDEKILADLAEYTGGKIDIQPDEIRLINDKEALAGVPQQTNNRKKKKK